MGPHLEQQELNMSGLEITLRIALVLVVVTVITGLAG